MKTRLLLFACFAALPSAQLYSQQDYRISGVVIDHLTNRPLNHVLVQIHQAAKGGGDAFALTEADGRFLFLHVPKGKYQLTAEKRGQPPQGFHADGRYATAIVVDGIHKTDDIVFSMRSDATINGTVTGDNGEPVRDAQITLLRQDVIEGVPQTTQARSGRTNSQGQFHFGRLEYGNYYVAVQATPWYSEHVLPDNRVVYPVTFFGDTTDANSARILNLSEGGSQDVQVTLRSVPAIRVSVADQKRGLAVFVPGPGGSRIPVPAALGPSGMRARHLTGGDVKAPEPQLMEITNLSAGRYEVARFAENGGYDALDQIVDLANGSTLSLDDGDMCAISGEVIVEGRRPSDSLEVFLRRNQREGASADVTSNGTFKFGKVAQGEYQVLLNASGLTVSSIQAKGASMRGDRLETPSGGAVQLTIHAIASDSLSRLEGSVTRDDIGFAGAMVLLMPQNLANTRLIRRDQSDSDGSFVLSDVVPGAYTLVAIDDGHDLPYKNEMSVKPYLAQGLHLTIPTDTAEPLKINVQARQR